MSLVTIEHESSDPDEWRLVVWDPETRKTVVSMATGMNMPWLRTMGQGVCEFIWTRQVKGVGAVTVVGVTWTGVGDDERFLMEVFPALDLEAAKRAAGGSGGS